MQGAYTGRRLWSLTEPHGALASVESVELCLNVTNKCLQFRTEQVEVLVEFCRLKLLVEFCIFKFFVEFCSFKFWWNFA